MEKTWQTLLNQLPLPDAEVTFDDVAEWLPGEFDGLKNARLLTDLPLATHVTCDACEEGHRERVRWSEDLTRAYIPCSAAGIANVRLERLQRWQVSQANFATWLSRGLGLSGEERRLPESCVWYLGQRKLGGRSPYFYFAAVASDEQESAMAEIRRAYGRVTGVLLVAFSPLTSVEASKLHVVDLNLVTSLQNAAITADISLIEDQFTESPPRGTAGSQRTEKKAPRQLAAHRLTLLKAFIPPGSPSDMAAIGRRLGASPSALYGMTRGDASRYRNEKLESVLTQIGCSRAKWDHVPKPSAAHK